MCIRDSSCARNSKECGVTPRLHRQCSRRALVVTLARAAKPIRELVVRLQLAEHTRALTLAIAENPCSSRSRSKIRLDVCRCFFGRSLSAARIASITPVNSSSFGRNGGFVRTYPGGTEKLQHLRDRSGIDAEPICRSTLADPLDQNGVPDPRVKLHCLHPPPPADSGKGL